MKLETRKKLSLIHKGKKPKNFEFFSRKGKKHSEETKRKIGEANKGLKHSEETKRKISIFRKGKKHSEESRKKMSISRKGQKHTKGKKYSIDKYPKLGFRKTRKQIVVPIKDTSIEIKIQNYLSKLHLEFYTHKYISEIKNSYQCDIFIPKQETEGVMIPKKTIIECDGCYWHGCKKCGFKKYNKNKDMIRTKELQEKGFRVIRLWEHDIRKMELNDLKKEVNYTH